MKFEELEIRNATHEDAEIIKNKINEMYGFEYEKRSTADICKAIFEIQEIYILALLKDECIGFAGATLDNEEYREKYKFGTVIDYIYIQEKFRGLKVAYGLIKQLFERLIDLGENTAIMQTQTYNKQRFLHYALSDKNIISVELCEGAGKMYEDQILLINDLRGVADKSFGVLLRKSQKYLNEMN